MVEIRVMTDLRIETGMQSSLKLHLFRRDAG